MQASRGRVPGRRAGSWRATAASALIILATMVFSTSVAAASPPPRPGSVVPGSGRNGTIAGKSSSGQHATVKHAAAFAPPTATGALSTVSSVVVHGGYTASGIGMRNLGYGTISVTGVPAGATVKSATLLWDILADQADPTFAQGTLNGSPVSGTEWASGASPCWPPGSNWSYEADVTSLVTGNGNYALAGFATGESDGADPWNVGSAPPLLEGASLVVVYQLASMPQAVIQIAEGATETASGNGADAALNGFTVGAAPSATTTYIVGDGQEAGNTAAFNGTTLPAVSFPGADPQAVPNYSQGNLWDTVTTDVSSLVSPGDTSATLAVTGNADCIVWVGQVLSVSSGSCTASAAFGLYKLTAEGGSCLVKNGSVYTDTGPVNLNGLNLIPSSGVITIDTNPSHEELSADNATVQIGNFPVYSGPIPATNLAGSFDLKTDKKAKIGGVKLGVGIKLTASGADGLTIEGTVSLPAKLGGAAVSLSVTMDAVHGLDAAGISAKNFFIPVRGFKVGLKAFSLSYDSVTDTWSGGATVGLPTPSGTEVAGAIVLTHGQVTQFSVAAHNLNTPLGPDGVFLQDIGANLVLAPPPPSITGTASITAGPKIKGVSAISVDGSLAYIFSNPGDLQLKGSLKLLKGTSFGPTLANGELSYFTSGHITVSGDASVSLAKIVSFNAMLSGWVNGTTAFSLTGSGSIKVGGWQIGGAEGVISTAGIAACAQPFGGFGPSIGFGYTWGGAVDVMGSSCGLGRYTVQPHGAAAPAGVTLPAGLPVASFKIAGTNGTAPAGTLTDPNGRTLSIDPAHQGTFTGTNPKYGLGVDATRGIDYVVIDAPAGGTWTFTPAAGSAVKSVSTAQGLPKPSLSAAVSGRNLHRRLSWRIGRLPGQKVTFVEEALGVDHILVSNVSAGSGRIAFTPANGPAGKRTIVAVVTQNGLTRESVRVASYTAPATASIQVTVQHSGKGRGVVRITPSGRTCRSSCSLSVRVGQVVTLMPVSARGSKFSWTQGLCTGSGKCKLTITQLTAVTGKFMP